MTRLQYVIFNNDIEDVENLIECVCPFELIPNMYSDIACDDDCDACWRKSIDED